VPYCNHGKYLPSALASLARQIFENFEVIVVDDGSTDAGAREAFANLKQNFPEPRFRFFCTENIGTGAARNFAVAQSAGDWLVFMDADNVATPEMLEVFTQAMQVSGADCATCHFAIFCDEAELRQPPVQTGSPLGQCLEAGWRGNIFGNANFIVKKKVFAELGGFATDRSAVEDWQFLVRLALRGFRQIVIPENLYWYRLLPDSMMRNADEARFSRIILETYREGLSSWTGRIIENHVFGPFANGRAIATATRAVATDTPAITTDTRATETNHSPTGVQARRAKFVKKFQKSCVKRLSELAEFVSRL
jgi:glycosyltransferase involved in cell wall biosynthesis